VGKGLGTRPSRFDAYFTYLTDFSALSN
jgi:hypothetical protein